MTDSQSCVPDVDLSGFADIVIICGHYGCGKTNLALNLARECAAAGEKVTLVDMDIVNPYFRASDYGGLLEGMGVELVAPTYAHSNLDLPSLPTEMYSIFTRTGRIIIDVGGDDSGSTALGRFSKGLSARAYTMLYVVNRYRALSETAEETAQLLGEIEAASRLSADCIINNSHLMQYTTEKTIADSFEYADRVAGLTGLPVMYTAARRELCGRLPDGGAPVWPVNILVTKPWESGGRQGD